MINTIKDVETLTTIPEKNLLRLCDKLIYCICDAVKESKEQGQDVVDLDIGIGVLSIKFDEYSVSYKFIPSKEFDDDIKYTVLEEQNLIEDKLEQSFIDKITNLYKDLL